MKRRHFLRLFGGAAAALPLAVQAQQAGKIWRMGFIAHGHERFYDALFKGLQELGYVEGQNLIVERRYAEGRAERFPEFAAEMVRLNVDVIVVVTTPAALAVKKATTTIPIVHPNAIDPLNTGLVASLAHPGGNLTGGAQLTAEAVQNAWRHSRKSCLGWREARFSGIRATQPCHLLGKRRRLRLASWE